MILTEAASIPGIDFDEFHLKNQGRIRRDGASRGGPGAVSEFLRDVEGGFSALFHQLQALCPSWNHAIQWKRNGFAAFEAGIKFLSVQQGAAVVNRHLVICVGGRALSHHGVLVLKARFGRVDAFFAAVFGQKRLTFLFDGLP